MFIWKEDWLRVVSKDGYKARIRQVEEAMEGHPRALATGGSTESIRSSSGPGLAMLPFLTINDIIALRRAGFKGLQDIEDRVLEVPDAAWEHVLELVEAGIARVPPTALVPPSAKPKKAEAAASSASNGASSAKAEAPKPKKPEKVKQERCAAQTADGRRCKNPSRQGSKYCSSHKGYRPPPKKKAKKKPAKKKKGKKKKGKKKAASKKKKKGKKKAAKKKSKKTKRKSAPKKKAAKGGGQPRCAATTADGKRCKNPSRGRSKYCASHKGYRPTS